MHTVVRVVTGIAFHQVVGTRLETVRVEQTRDARAGHAAPVVVVALEKAKQHSHLGVTCETREGTDACHQSSTLIGWPFGKLDLKVRQVPTV